MRLYCFQSDHYHWRHRSVVAALTLTLSVNEPLTHEMVLKQKYLTDQADPSCSQKCHLSSLLGNCFKEDLIYKVGKTIQTTEVKFVANTANHFFSVREGTKKKKKL